MLSKEDSKLEGFDGTGSWCLIFSYIRVKFCVCVCYYVIYTSPFYANSLFFTGNHTRGIGELVFECIDLFGLFTKCP